MSNVDEGSVGRCAVCGASRPIKRSVGAVKPGLRAMLEEQAGHAFDDDDDICQSCLRAGQIDYVEGRLGLERGRLTELEAEVARRAAEHSIMASDTNRVAEQTMTLGQRTADRVARVGGSWSFVLGFAVTIAIWAVLNSVLLTKAFDPYPYILLNLVLSCIAAMQAPIIMMSQNRSEALDRARAQEDYAVNLKAELEVGALHEKIDHLLHERWETIVEMQQEQLDLLRDLLDRSEGDDESAELERP